MPGAINHSKMPTAASVGGSKANTAPETVGTLPTKPHVSKPARDGLSKPCFYTSPEQSEYPTEGRCGAPV